jgi:hypothetical protein
MDDRRFDEVSKYLSTGLSRKGALRLLGGLGAAGVAATSVLQPTDAKKKGKGKGKGKGKKNGSSRRTNAEAAVPPTKVPQGGREQCPPQGMPNQEQEACACLGYPSSKKIEPVEDGTYGGITIDRDGNSLDWSATFSINAVILKASTFNNVYDYNGAPRTSDTDLVSPTPDSISHVIFCWGGDATTTTTPQATTTTTPQATTTTTPQATTTTTPQATTTTTPQATTTTGVPCVPKTCADYKGECGDFNNGCGGKIECGCDKDETCEKHVCTPKVGCEKDDDCAKGKICCDNICVAGDCCDKDDCDKDETCKNHTCTPDCTPKTCAADYAGLCGTFPQGCGLEKLTCTCDVDETCTGQNQSGQGTCTAISGCIPVSQDVACAGRQCGPASNGCGVDYQCGTGVCPTKKKKGQRAIKQTCLDGVCLASKKKRCIGKGLAGQPCSGKCKCANGRKCDGGRCCEGRGDGSVHCNANNDCCPGLMCAYRRPGQHRVCMPNNAKGIFTESTEATATPGLAIGAILTGLAAKWGSKLTGNGEPASVAMDEVQIHAMGPRDQDI